MSCHQITPGNASVAFSSPGRSEPEDLDASRHRRPELVAPSADRLEGSDGRLLVMQDVDQDVRVDDGSHRD
jgi:hypothetical protein